MSWICVKHSFAFLIALWIAYIIGLTFIKFMQPHEYNSSDNSPVYVSFRALKESVSDSMSLFTKPPASGNRSIALYYVIVLGIISYLGSYTYDCLANL